MLHLLLLLSLLTVKVHPNGYQNSPLNIEVVVSVEKDSRNRSLAVDVVGEDYFASSQRELDGAKAPSTQRFTFRGLREGHYDIYSTLLQWKDGKWVTSSIKSPDKLEVH